MSKKGNTKGSGYKGSSFDKLVSFKGKGNIQKIKIPCPSCKEKFDHKFDRRNIDAKINCPHCGVSIEIDAKSRSWRCEYCNKSFKTKPEAEKHEKKCKSKKKDKVTSEEELKNQISIEMAEYREWVDDVINEINEGGLSQSEVIENLKEAKIKTDEMLTSLRETKSKLKNKSFIKLVDDRIKDMKEELIAIDDMIEKHSKAGNAFACPYCKREINVKEGIQDKEMEIECELCHKKFICLTGVVSVVRGNPNRVVQYGAEPISITLKLKNENTTVNFQTRFRFLVHKGDRISFIYLKKFLSPSYKEKPSFIFNLSAEDVFKI